MSSEKVMGPFTVAADSRAVGRENVVGDAVMFVRHVGHAPEGGFELSVEDAAR
jgi:hypothetical protein